METDPEPHNELESMLVDAQIGKISSDQLLEALGRSQVFMPVEGEKSPTTEAAESSPAQPLVLKADDGTPVLILFSSPERSREFVKDYPGYGGGLLIELAWVLERLGRNFGIALNPGSEIGFDMEPETVNDLIDSLSNQPKH